MREFHYTARSFQGETVTGSLKADSEAAVLRVLEEKQLFPVEIRDLVGAPGAKGTRGPGRIPSRDLGDMYSQLADLMARGSRCCGRWTRWSNRRSTCGCGG